MSAFVDTFEVTPEQAKVLDYQSIAQWDSVGHMSLIAALEDAFDIMMDADDIIDFNSFNSGLTILKKYGIEF